MRTLASFWEGCGLSFRIEEKIVVTTNELFGVRERLGREGMTELFPARVIRSVYFDSRTNGMFVDSEEGSLPRKKLRIRTYDGSTSGANFETKISSVEGRFKTTKKLTGDDRDRLIENGIVDSRYGLCDPRVEISYTRKYYQLSGVRITFDTNIRYRRQNSLIEASESLNVMEIKAPAEAPSDFLLRLVAEPRRRFSKFSRAFSLTGISLP